MGFDRVKNNEYCIHNGLTIKNISHTKIKLLKIINFWKILIDDFEIFRS
jgi:hypothetical protein